MENVSKLKEEMGCCYCFMFIIFVVVTSAIITYWYISLPIIIVIYCIYLLIKLNKGKNRKKWKKNRRKNKKLNKEKESNKWNKEKERRKWKKNRRKDRKKRKKGLKGKREYKTLFVEQPIIKKKTKIEPQQYKDVSQKCPFCNTITYKDICTDCGHNRKDHWKERKKNENETTFKKFKICKSCGFMFSFSENICPKCNLFFNFEVIEIEETKTHINVVHESYPKGISNYKECPFCQMELVNSTHCKYCGWVKEEIKEKPKRSRRIPIAVQREVWRRDKGKCSNCGSREKLEYDHIIPFSKGGSNTVRNIELLCEKCNRKKSNKI